MEDSERFWAWVDRSDPDGCWIWGRYVDGLGYGRVALVGEVKAHRVAYVLTHGPIPRGRPVLHSCDVRSCVRPEHLTLGTQAENMAEMMARGRYKAVGDAHRRVVSPARKAELRAAYVEALFWSKVDRRSPDECWEWQAGFGNKGYGSVGHRGKVWGAHRVAYDLTFGDPGALCVMHACDNPPCVNPAHLSLGTKSENSLDMYRKGRARIGDMPSGERHHNSKLTEALVLEMRAAHAAGVQGKDLVVRFGVSAGVVSEVVNRRAWKHVV